MQILISLIIAIGLIATTLYWLAHYNIWRPKINNNYPRILMYHSVNSTTDHVEHKDLVVQPKQFEKQLKYLINNQYQFYTVSEIIHHNNLHKAVAISFDDGFKDNYDQVFPLLKKYQAKATIYLATDYQTIPKLNQDHINEMQASGLVEFGAHTLNHVNLNDCKTNQAKLEIVNSKHAVETLTQQPCYSFAYPFGRYNDTTVELVRQAGFTSAVTVKKGINAIDNPFKIKRLSILGKTNTLQFHIAITRGRYRV